MVRTRAELTHETFCFLALSENADLIPIEATLEAPNIAVCSFTQEKLPVSLSDGMMIDLLIGYNSENTYFVQTCTAVLTPVIHRLNPRNVNLNLATSVYVDGKWPQTGKAWVKL